MRDHANKCLACFVNPDVSCDNCERNWCSKHWSRFNNMTEKIKQYEGKWTFHCPCGSVKLRHMYANKLLINF